MLSVNDEAFGFLLVTAARLMRGRYETALGQANLGLTPGEARTLVSAERQGPVRQADLALALGIEPMSLVNVLDRLEARGLIRRVASTHDRRSKQVVVTTEARPTIRRIRRVLDEARTQALAGFSAAERTQFTASLERLCCALNPAMAAATGKAG